MHHCSHLVYVSGALQMLIIIIIIGMRAAYSFKHPLFSHIVEFCGWVCVWVCPQFFKMLLLRHFLSD